MALLQRTYSGGGAMVESPMPASPGGGSRLAQMQARFQQKQMLEKEQKLLRLYESQQQRAFQRVGRNGSGSAGSSSVSSVSSISSTSSLGAGKVRQLFDGRRSNKSGYDRSYPLEPLEASKQPGSKPRATRGASLDRSGSKNPQPVRNPARRSKSQVRGGAIQQNGNYNLAGSFRQQPRHQFQKPSRGDDYFNGDETYAVQEHQSFRRLIEDDDNSNRVLNRERRDIIDNVDHNSVYNKRNNLIEDEDFPDFDEDEDEDELDTSHVFSKLSNVGNRPQLKEINDEENNNRDKYKTYIAGNKDDRKKMAAPAATRERVPRTREAPISPPPRAAPKPAPRKSELKVGQAIVAGPVHGTTSKMNSQPRATSQPTKPITSSPPKAGPVKAATRQGATPTKPPHARLPPGASPVVNTDLAPCKICGRRFAPDRIQAHQEICAKTAQKKRKVFDPVKQRIQGTEQESYVKKASRRPPPKETKKQDWRRKHEDFINTIRAAKQVTAHIAAGGKVSDLPPPPTSDTSDYTQCPHCNRRFNSGAAERHIPICATMIHNKPKPVAKGAVPKRR